MLKISQHLKIDQLAKIMFKPILHYTPTTGYKSFDFSIVH